MTGRRLQTAFFVSLALNLFLVGLIVGGLLISLRGDSARPRPRGAGHYWAAAQQFDAADREAFEALLRRESQENAPRVTEMRRSRREAQRAMNADAFDPAAVRAALARAHQAELAVRADVDAAVLQFAERLDQDERAALGEAMRRPKGRRGDRRRPAR
ncbi:MAG TPA: periplasmic heavy metal sensor [Caulobacteraceae bacterium]